MFTEASQPSVVGIAAGHEEVPGLLLFDRDIEHDPIRRRAGLRSLILTDLEIAERFQMPLAAVDHRAVISVAFAEIEFAADHVVMRCGIAVDVDALDIKPLCPPGSYR